MDSKVSAARSAARPSTRQLAGSMPTTYVPFRNAILLAAAVAWAELRGDVAVIDMTVGDPDHVGGDADRGVADLPFKGTVEIGIGDENPTVGGLDGHAGVTV